MHTAPHHPYAQSQPDPLRLTPDQRRLLDLLVATHFGRLERLHVMGGQPVFDPPPVSVRTLKMGGKNEPRPHSAGEFVRRAAVAELLAHFSRMGDAVIDRIEVAHGLPLLIEVREPVRP